MTLIEKLKHQKIIIATHVYATGPTHALEDYLKAKVKKLIFIGHPFVFAKEKRSHLHIFEDFGAKSTKKFSPLVFGNQFISVVKDTILTLWWIIGQPKSDLFIGADSFNAITGIILQKLGKVEKTVFYTIDYIPNRFENKWLNKFYHWMDIFAVKHCDHVWNLSQVMVEEREKGGLSADYRKKQIVVPMGTESEVQSIPFEKIMRHTAVHMGHLIPKQGVQLIIEAIADIVKAVPQFHLDIIGGGSYEDELKELAKKHQVETYITWFGFVQNHQEVEEMLTYRAFGLAPYINSVDNYIQYTDPGKVKAYLAADLPIIITKMTQIAHEINDRECGLAIEYDKQELVNACVSLLTDDALLKKMKKNVIVMAEKYSWENIFKHALQPTIE